MALLRISWLRSILLRARIHPILQWAAVRQFRYFECHKCGRMNADYLTFGVGEKNYCLNHIPLWTRIRMKLGEWRLP